MIDRPSLPLALSSLRQTGPGTLPAIGGSYHGQASGVSAAKGGKKRGDEADGWAALERDLERVGVPPAGPVAMHSTFGRQMWEFKQVNHAYAMIPTYPQVCVLLYCMVLVLSYLVCLFMCSVCVCVRIFPEFFALETCGTFPIQKMNWIASQSPDRTPDT